MSWEFEVFQPPLYSAIIPTYGQVGLEMTLGLLESIQRHSDFAHEVIVVDDGSEEPVADELARTCADVQAKFIHLEENVGFAIACNRGMEQANGWVIILVNNDVRLIGPTLDSLADQVMVSDAGVMGCKLLYPNGTVQHAGVFYHPQLPFDHYCRHEGRYSPRARLTVVDRRLISGALMAIHSNTIAAIGLFDENFGCAAEDIDYCLSTLEVGRHVIYNGLIEAFHLEGQTRGSTPEAKAQFPHWVEREEKGLQHLFDKWYGINFDMFQQQ